jgi:hypothetical protein
MDKRDQEIFKKLHSYELRSAFFEDKSKFYPMEKMASFKGRGFKSTETFAMPMEPRGLSRQIKTFEVSQFRERNLSIEKLDADEIHRDFENFEEGRFNADAYAQEDPGADLEQPVDCGRFRIQKTAAVFQGKRIRDSDNTLNEESSDSASSDDGPTHKPKHTAKDNNYLRNSLKKHILKKPHGSDLLMGMKRHDTSSYEEPYQSDESRDFKK